MSLLGLVIVLVVFGVILWLINTYIPLQPPFKAIINVVVILFLCIWLLDLFGFLHDVRVPVR